MEAAGSASDTPSVDFGGVLPTETNRRLVSASPMRTWIVLIFIFAVAIFFIARFSRSLKGADFPDFYCAARMLADGHGHQLYDADLQREYQARYTGRVGTLYIHPPFEAVLYLAVAWLPLRPAYLLWSWLNLIFLAVALRRLAKAALAPWDWSVLLAASLVFVPAILCFQQGQDSLLLLMLVTLAFTNLRSGSGFAAGAWLGLSLFKFQIAVPLVVVLLLTEGRNIKKELSKGFAVVVLALAGLSAAISGWSVLTVYPKFLLHLATQPFAGVMPQAMANFRGLTYFFFHRDRSLWAVAALSSVCVAALIKVLQDWKHARLESHSTVHGRSEFDFAFANTVLFALLVSYHLNPHDLSLLLLPIPVLLHRLATRAPRLWGTERWVEAGLLGILFLPPIHLWALRAGDYVLVSFPLVALFLTAASRRPAETSGQR